MIEIIAAGVVCSAVGYVVAAGRHRCNHNWMDTGWTQDWKLTEQPKDEFSGQPGRHRLKRGMTQECERCGHQRTTMRTAASWKLKASEVFHGQLSETRFVENEVDGNE